MSKIFSRYFRVFAHIYHAHYQEMTSVEMDATLNTSFKHLVLFVTQFKLVSDDEMAPLRVLVDRILKKASAASSSSSS